jgi:hypothetical protein
MYNPRDGATAASLRDAIETNLKARRTQLQALDTPVAAQIFTLLVAHYSYVTEAQLVTLCPLLWRYGLDDTCVELFGPARSVDVALQLFRHLI